MQETTSNNLTDNYTVQVAGAVNTKLSEVKSPIFTSLGELQVQLNLIGENIDRLKSKTATVRIELPREAYPEGTRDSTSMLLGELGMMVEQARKINSEMNAIIGEIEL